MSSRRHCAPTIVAMFALMIAASRCGSTPASTTEAGAATQSTAPASARNACQLVDREDMERLAHGKVTLLHDIVAAEQTNCEVYPEGDSTRPVLTLEAYWTGGKQIAQTDRGAAGLARKILNDKDVDISALTGSSSTPGAADDAFYSDVMPSWVLKNDVMLKFIAPGLKDDMQQNFVPLASKALSRLK